MKLNTPNRLTVSRIILSPLFMFFMVYPVFGMDTRGINISLIVAAALFGIAAFTDFLDGKIARDNKIITNFGIFLDPLADKFMVFSALISICYSDFVIPDALLLKDVFFWTTAVIIFRELAITSMRLIVSNASNVVVAANYLGKIKTVSQITCIVIVLIEGVFLPDLFGGIRVFSLVSAVTASVFTVWSGINYLKAYWNYLKP